MQTPGCCRREAMSSAGYNVQIAVDAKHKLIATSEVVNDGNDTGQLYEVAEAAKEALGVETLEAVADTGYYNGATLKECEEGGIVAYVPPPRRTGGLEEQGRFTHEAFSYDAEANVYRCPAGALLKPMNGVKISPAGRQDVRYVSLKSVCKACHLRERCLGQMPGRLSPLPGPWLRQGPRRMESDGALLQSRPHAEHPRLRRICHVFCQSGGPESDFGREIDFMRSARRHVRYQPRHRLHEALLSQFEPKLTNHLLPLQHRSISPGFLPSLEACPPFRQRAR